MFNKKADIRKVLKTKEIRLIVLSFIFNLITITNLFADQNSFSIYLVADKNPYSCSFSEDRLQKYKLQEKPFINLEDIVSYYGNTHEIQLTKSAYGRVSNFRSISCPFVVCAENERIYTGDLVSLACSASFNGIVIWEPGFCEEPPKLQDMEDFKNWEFFYDLYQQNKQRIIKLNFGYPNEQYFKGLDLRSDPRILKVLQKAGKLKTKVTIPDRVIYDYLRGGYSLEPWFEYPETWEVIFSLILAALLIVVVIRRKS
jgi:hypothetical protein